MSDDPTSEDTTAQGRARTPTRRQFLTRYGPGAVALALGAGALGAWLRQSEDVWFLPDLLRSARPETLPDGVRLTILSGRDDSLGGQRRRLVARWNELHPGQRAQLVEVSGNANHAHAVMHEAARAGYEAIDLFNLDVVWIAQFADRGHIWPLTTDTAGLLDAPLEAGRWDGRLWALPFNTDVGLLYYNKAHLDHVGVTETSWETWTAVASSARQVLDRIDWPRDLPRPEGGVAMQLADYEGLSVNVLEWLYGSGVRPTADRLPDLTGSAAGAALENLAARLRDDTILRDSRGYDEGAALAAFQEGRTTFLRHWPSAYRSLTEVAGLDVGVATLPGAVLGGQSLAVSRHTRFPFAARALAEFLGGAQSQRQLYAQGGFASARRSAYASDSVAGDDVFATTLLTALGSARRRPAVPRWDQVSAALSSGIHDGLPNGIDGAYLRALQPRLDAAVEGKA